MNKNSQQEQQNGLCHPALHTFEITAAGFDGGSDATDDRVFWVQAESAEVVQQAIAGTRAIFHHETIDGGSDIDFRLPADFDVMRSALIRFTKTEDAESITRFTTADADRLLGLADQFLEDWEGDEGSDDLESEERRTEYDAIRPLFVAAPEMLEVLKTKYPGLELLANGVFRRTLSADHIGTLTISADLRDGRWIVTTDHVIGERVANTLLEALELEDCLWGCFAESVCRTDLSDQ